MSTKSASKLGFHCTECGWESVKWVGRCGECQAWNTMVESAAPRAARLTIGKPVSNSAQPIGTVDVSPVSTWATGVEEFDRVLGGGIVPGEVVLLAGEPGVGKSTLVLDIAAKAARHGRRVLYITGEESAAQVRLRAERIGAIADGLFIVATCDLGEAVTHMEQAAAHLIVIDSVQTIATDSLDAGAGGVAQVKNVAASVIAFAKQTHTAALLIGHVTKDGTVAGPRTLEHVVDAVCQFEGDAYSQLRMLRTVKNRFGPADEVGCFEMLDTGIVGVPDPSGLFVSSSTRETPGACLHVAMEGRRALGAEVQALVAPSQLPSPKRTTSGLDSSRLAMILAVLERRLGIHISNCDVYASTVGGAKIYEPAADLAIALACVSGRWDEPLPSGVAAIGEVGLSGEIRKVTGQDRRIAEAARLGLSAILIPAGSNCKTVGNLTCVEVADLAQAVAAATQLKAKHAPHSGNPTTSMGNTARAKSPRSIGAATRSTI